MSENLVMRNRERDSKENEGSSSGNTDRKEYISQSSSYSSLTAMSSKRNAAPPCAVSYKPFECPTRGCTAILSPSTVISHFKFEHRELPPLPLHPGRSLLLDVSDQLVSLLDRDPVAIRVLVLDTRRFGRIPLVLNLCAVSDLRGATDDFELLSDQWVAVWLSTLYTLPYWLTVRIVGPAKKNCFCTFTSKPLVMGQKPTAEDLVESESVTLVSGRLLELLYSPEEGVCVEITAHRQLHV